MKELALFDFDGTITWQDTFTRFLKFSRGKGKFYGTVLLIFPAVIAYYCGWVSNAGIKNFFMRRLWKGETADAFRAAAEQFSRECLARMIRADAWERIAWHQAQQHRIIILSASFEAWLAPWCRQHGFELVANQIETERGVLTGKIAGKNCEGQEKARRLREVCRLEEYGCIYAYGDSPADLPLLDCAHSKYYRHFKSRKPPQELAL